MRRILLVLVLLFGFTAQPSLGATPLIIQISPFANITSIAAALGGTVVDSIPGSATYLLNVPAVPPQGLASLLGIQWMEVNQGVTLPAFRPFGVVTVPANTAPDWYRHQPSMVLIRAGDALVYSRGRTVVVADLNSRVDVAHPALLGHLTAGYDFVASRPNGSTALNQSSSSFMDDSPGLLNQSSSSFMDQFSASILNQSSSSFMDGTNPAYSHGTLCAGIVAVMAPESMIMPLRVFDDQGSADLFIIAKAIRYAVDQGAHVINMSFGTLQKSEALKNAVDFALSRSVVLVASAGNNDTSAPQYPAAFSGVITTAATDLFDLKASFSNYGSYIYVDAPGVNIFSSYPGGYYSVVDGTSFSAPIIAGTAALIRSLQTKNVANDIAKGSINIDWKNPQYKNQLGNGRIDVPDAVQ